MGFQLKEARPDASFWIWGASSWVVRTANQPVGLRSWMAAGIAWVMLSTARRVTQS